MHLSGLFVPNLCLVDFPEIVPNLTQRALGFDFEEFSHHQGHETDQHMGFDCLLHVMKDGPGSQV